MSDQRGPLRFARLWRPLLAASVVIGVVLPATAARADPLVREIEQQIKQASTRLEGIVEQYDKLNEQLKANQARAAGIAARLGPLRQQMDAASDRISMLAANAYKGADLESTVSLLTSGSPATFIDRMTTMDHVARAQQQQVDEFIATKARHDAEAANLAMVIQRLRLQRRDLAATKAQITKDLAHLYALRTTAYGAAQAAAARAAASRPVPPYVAGRAGVAVRYAYGALGTPYAWAAGGPGSYDCSGLTMAAWRAAGVQLPHNAEMQWNAVPHLSRGSLSPGDLVFYHNLGHVAIYVGNGLVIQAPTFGEVVQLSPVDFMTPYGYGRPS